MTPCLAKTPWKVLSGKLEKLGKNYRQLATAADEDPAYVWRLVQGIKTHPSLQKVLRLAGGLMALGMSVNEGDDLLLAASYGPLFGQSRLDSRDPWLRGSSIRPGKPTEANADPAA